MRTTLFLLVAAAIAVAAAWVLSGLPGTIAVSLAGYSVETSTALAIFAAVLVIIALLAVFQLLRWFAHIPDRLSLWRVRRRRLVGDNSVSRTLVAIAAGDGTAAVQESVRARKLLGDTPQTLLLAAEAQRLAGRDDEATKLYHALADRTDGALLGLRGLFRQAINREAWSEAAAIAEQAERSHPGGAWLREERAQLAVHTGNWRQALQLAAPEAPRAAFATALADAETDQTEALRLARRTWRENPGYAPAALTYARRLRQSGDEVRALRVMRETWAISPVPDLASFSLAAVTDPDARLREAHRIVSNNEAHPESQFLLARLQLDAGHVAEARKNLDRARAAGLQQRRLWLLLADLELREHGDSEAGQAAQREALRRAALAEPDAAWRCEACGTEQAHWHPACPACHTAGRVTWGTRPLALLAN